MNQFKKRLRNVLSEVRENKEKNTIEKNLVSKRFKIILEDSINFKKQKPNLLSKLIKEVKTLKNNGYSSKSINEGLSDIFTSLFGSKSDMVFNTWRDKGVTYLIEKLGLESDEEAVRLVKKEFSNVLPSEVPELFTNCDKVAEMMVNSLIESFQKKLISLESDVEATKIIQESILEMTSHDDFQRSIEVKMKNLICPLLSKISDNIVKQEEDIKSKILSSDLDFDDEETSDLAV